MKIRLKTRLEYQVFKACGRVSNGELFIKGVIVTKDDGLHAAARLLFATLNLEEVAKRHAVPGDPQKVSDPASRPSRADRVEGMVIID